MYRVFLEVVKRDELVVKSCRLRLEKGLGSLGSGFSGVVLKNGVLSMSVYANSPSTWEAKVGRFL